MNLEKYPLESKSHTTFEFISVGPSGRIRKIIVFIQIEEQNNRLYNLCFGDWDKTSHLPNDQIVSNNKDSRKVLATVAAAVLEFTKRFPKAIIYAKGSSESRTRLYQMQIASYLTEITNLFQIKGLKNGIWEPFKLGINYEAFLLTRQKSL
ncbi:MAG TPA: hypothetical protein VG890_00620 [Puia sp.]|nr:hypothetical protein [Puia sp.]